MEKIYALEMRFEDKELGFTSTKQDVCLDKQVLWNETVVINMSSGIEIIEGEQVFQAIVCERCGYTNCEPGNWVAIRQIENKIFFLPIYEWIVKDGRKVEGDYYPPKYLTDYGIFEIEKIAFEKLKLQVPAFGMIKEVKAMSGLELYESIKYESPITIREKIGLDLVLTTDNLIATNAGDLEEVIQELGQELDRIKRGDKFELIDLLEQEEEINLYIDDYKTTEWKIGIKEGDKTLIRLGDYKIKIDTNK